MLSVTGNDIFTSSKHHLPSRTLKRKLSELSLAILHPLFLPLLPLQQSLSTSLAS